MESAFFVRGFMPRTFIMSEVKMGRKELLSSLYELKKKIEACDLIKKSINGYESQVSETQKKITAETCPNKMPADVPPYDN